MYAVGLMTISAQTSSFGDCATHVHDVLSPYLTSPELVLYLYYVFYAHDQTNFVLHFISPGVIAEVTIVLLRLL